MFCTPCDLAFIPQLAGFRGDADTAAPQGFPISDLYLKGKLMRNVPEAILSLETTVDLLHFTGTRGTLN